MFMASSESGSARRDYSYNFFLKVSSLMFETCSQSWSTELCVVRYESRPCIDITEYQSMFG
jgi:hypothetical protein